MIGGTIAGLPMACASLAEGETKQRMTGRSELW